MDEKEWQLKYLILAIKCDANMQNKTDGKE